MIDTSWIAVDWGTSNLRLWLMSTDNQVLAYRQSEDGMAGLEPTQFGPALLALIGADLPPGPSVPVICCGMAGSRQGWAEAPYLTTPCTPPGLREAARLRHETLDVHILPGIKQDDPADVMRGEETQIMGYLDEYPDFDGVLCLPGTHTKWVHISAREVVSFRTFMSGEIFAFLAEQSVLRHSVQADALDMDVFRRAVEDTMARPTMLAADLFGIRAETLLKGLPPAQARARLSGLLIGAELAGARPYWLGQNITLIGAQKLCDLYAAALDAQGSVPARASGEDTVLRGLIAARTQIESPRP